MKRTPKEQKLYDAVSLVLLDLKAAHHCKDKDYCIGCYGCGLRLVGKTLASHYDFNFSGKIS